MANYRVQGPDGTWYRFSGPDNATDAEVHAYAQQQAKAHTDRLAATQAQMRAEYDPTKDMNWGEKALANVGAGLATTGQGAQQLAGKVLPSLAVSDADIREKRAIDKHLAQQTAGGGALQTVGEAAPMLAVPGAGLVAGAAAGAAGGALQPVTSDENRLKNAAVGGVAGGVLGKVLPYTLGKLGGAAQSVAGTIGKVFGSNEAAVQRMLQGAAKGDPEALQALQQYVASNPDIPLSGAAAARSAGLARLEAGARAKNPEAFYPLDQSQGAAVFKKTLGATEGGTPQNIAALRNTRKAEWDSNWKTASEVADPQVFAAEIPKFRANLDAALMSPEASNPAVRGVVNEIRSEMDRLGDNLTPAHLQQMRANLNARGHPMPTNAYQSAPRDSTAVNSLVDEMDSILNKTTNGAWDAVKGGYATSTEAVNAAKAAARVRGKYVDPEGGEVIGKSIDPLGEVPQITEHGLSRAIQGTKGPAGQEMLAPEARTGLEETLGALRQQGIVQRVKGSATAGGGSNTKGDTAAAAALDAALMPGAGRVLQWFTGGKDAAREQLANKALADPGVLLDYLGRPVGAASKVGDFAGDVLERTRNNTLVKALRETAASRSLGGAAGVDLVNQFGPQPQQ